MRKFCTLLIAVILTASISAQSPQKMSYQAVVRNSSNELVKSSPVGMRTSILRGSAAGTEVYKEIFNPNPQTNSNGLVTIEIGVGTVITGIFANIDWSSGPYFLKTETDPTGGTNYTITGTSQLLSVPYALHALTAESISGGIIEIDPVYTASPSKGITAANITNWNTSFGWGNHTGLYRPLNYVPAWAEIDSNPFSFTSVSNNQLIRYNSTSGKWENWTPAYLTSYTETDPIWTVASANYYTKTNLQTSGGSQVHFGNITNKPTTLAGYGITDAFNGTWVNLTGKPITIAGYGITDAMSTSHAANAITATNITNWSTAYSWGNHSGLYRPIGYVPSWSEITANPFLITSAANNQLLKYNSVSGKWENWTPNFITGYTETDPVFVAWNKSTGISITAAQVSDFQSNVTNNSDVMANTAKNSYPATDATKLAGIAAGAEVNINADWNAASGDALILNKPVVDGSETKLTTGTNITLTGAGTQVNPYVIKSAVSGYSHYIGELLDGGIVYYIYKGSDGFEHGLIVGLTESTGSWQSVNELVSANRMWDGAYNTNLMTSGQAKTFITSLGSGWYLPSIDELSLLWHNRFLIDKALSIGGYTPLYDGIVGGYSEGPYWSSTESSVSQAWAFDFHRGSVYKDQTYDNTYKQGVLRVRGVRSF